MCRLAKAGEPFRFEQLQELADRELALLGYSTGGRVLIEVRLNLECLEDERLRLTAASCGGC